MQGAVGRKGNTWGVCAASDCCGRFGMSGTWARTWDGQRWLLWLSGLGCNAVPGVPGAWQHLFHTQLFSCCKPVLRGRSNWQAEREEKWGLQLEGFEAA